MRAMVSCRLYNVRPQPGQEIYSVLVNLMRAACRMASANSVRCWVVGVGGWLLLLSITKHPSPITFNTSFIALRSMSSAPTAIEAFSCSVSQSGASKVSVMVSFWMLASASSRRRAHSAIISTSLRATGISHSGSSESDTRMVSPMPSVSRAPIPTALLMRPSSPSPASVTPKCSG